jgi:hypothetical protein
LSIQHYLIKLVHNILCAVDQNSKKEAYAVILNMVDWSQAFDRQSHFLGIKSFIQNGLRPSLIPVLISFFQDRRMVVKWNGVKSSSRPLHGGGTLGIIEYTSQSNDNADFVGDDEQFKFIDDLSLIEIINLIMQGLASFNCKLSVPADIATDNKFLPSEMIKSNQYMETLSEWTKSKQMKLNVKKTKYMLINFTKNYQFNTRIYLEGNLLDQVHEARLLGLILSDDLSWKSNTEFLVKKAYKRMSILTNLFKFSIPREELIDIYILYIRSVVEQSSTVWHSSLTKGEKYDLERVQKVALKIILRDQYTSYEDALQLCNLKTLSDRRSGLCLSFAKKCVKNAKTQDIFPLNDRVRTTRISEKYKVTKANTDRLAKSAIPYMQRLLNSQK